MRLCPGVLLPLLLLASSADGQDPPAADPSPGSTLTLQTGTRLVLTDLLVSDRDDNPVHGLPATAFHITEDKKPQDLASFEEHQGEEHPAAATEETSLHAPKSALSGTYSNDFLLHPPPVLNILVLDTTNIALEDQMFLSFQLTRFLQTFPPGASLAIYGRSGPRSVLLQNFTTDRTLLLAAINHALPRLPPSGREFLTDLATLQQISDSFGDLPGRKNVIWFTGGSSLFLRQDATQIRDYDRWRRIYDQLEASRIAIFPIDARGLTAATGPGLANQHFLMSEVAEATGGKAFFDNNGLGQIAARITANGGDFYTVTYSPRNYHEDKKWHRVAIAVDGGYTLSYRRGYFADGFNASQQARRSGIGFRLLADGSKITQEEVSALPIIFQARVIPAADAPVPSGLPPLDPPLKKNEMLYTVRYTIPAKELTFTPFENQQQQIHFLAAAFAFNRDGTVVDHKAERLTITVPQAQYQLVSRVGVPVQQQLRLHKGDNFLLLAVADPTTGRAGRIQLTLVVPATPAH